MSDSVTSRTAARKASLSITISLSLLKLLPIESVMPFSHLILCHHLLHLPSIFPSTMVFSNESALLIRWTNTGASASSSVLLMNIQGWFPLRLTALISVLFKGLSGVFCNTTLHYTPVVHIFNSNYQFSRSVVSDSFAILQLKYNFKKLKRK